MTEGLGLFLELWIGIALGLVVFQWRTGHAGVGLLVAYLLSFWMTHWVGAAIYVYPPGFVPDRAGAAEFTTAGFLLSTYAIAAFAAGALLMSAQRLRPKDDARRVHARSPAEFQWFAVRYLAAGAGSFVLLAAGLGKLPSLTAILSGAQSLLLVGACLLCWAAYLGRASRRIGYLLVASGLGFPFVTLMTQGFLGYGVAAFLTVVSFLSVVFRPRWLLVLGGIAGIYVGLSVYVTYMAARNDLRAAVWAGESLDSRLAVLTGAVASAQAFDWGNGDHLQAIDDRLNQNYLVGAAMDNTPAREPYAQGETLLLGLVALVPRIVWPDKPVQAGSMTWANQYTGIEFATGTSVGVGQVMEFYVNFGVPGVVVGFLFLGAFIAYVDRVAAYHLHQGDISMFAFWFVIGIAMLQVGGAVAEITASAGGGAAAVWIVNRIVYRLATRRRVAVRGR